MSLALVSQAADEKSVDTMTSRVRAASVSAASGDGILLAELLRAPYDATAAKNTVII